MNTRDKIREAIREELERFTGLKNKAGFSRLIENAVVQAVHKTVSDVEDIVAAFTPDHHLQVSFRMPGLAEYVTLDDPLDDARLEAEEFYEQAIEEEKKWRW